VNGDYSGVEPEELPNIAAFIERIKPARVVDIARDEAGEPFEPRFTWQLRLYDPLANTIGGEVIDYTTHEVAP
jgi:hypothetical protein